MEAVLTARQMRRLRRRVIARKRNEPPVLTVGEEVFNAVSHGLGAALAIAATVLLLVRSDTGLKVMASCFYGVSMFLMMLISTAGTSNITGCVALQFSVCSSSSHSKALSGMLMCIRASSFPKFAAIRKVSSWSSRRNTKCLFLSKPSES